MSSVCQRNSHYTCLNVNNISIGNQMYWDGVVTTTLVPCTREPLLGLACWVVTAQHGTDRMNSLTRGGCCGVKDPVQ